MTAVEHATRAPAALAAIEGDNPQFMTFEGVELLHVGMEWPTATTGKLTLTLEHLADAVAAWSDDPHILDPRLKIGHEDPRFNEDPTVYDPFAYHGALRDDGNPVYGKATNLRLAEDGMVVLGDYVEVPAWLGNSLPSAYPSRSCEGAFNVTTEGGKKYSFVLTAVALLGEPLPAISCLEDLARELTGGPAAVLEQTPGTLNKETTLMSTPVALEASTDAVRAQFFDEFAQGDRYWWWPCELRVEDGWVLADDDEGHLYRVPFTIDADGIVGFGDPVSGVLDFRPTPDPEAGEPVAASRGVHFSSPRMAGRPQDRVRTAAATTTEGAHMADETNNVSTTLLERLGLSEDATTEDIQAATLARMDELEAAAPAAEPEVQPEPVAASSDRTVTVDRAQFSQLQQDAEMGRTARLAMLSAEADGLVDAATREGRIAPASAAAWRTAILPDGATALVDTEVAALSQLEKGRVPVDERGVNPSPENETASLARVRAALGLKTPTGN